jgi:hypothetical protein
LNNYVTREEFAMLLEALARCKTLRQVRGACHIAAVHNQAEIDADPFKTALTDRITPITVVPAQRRRRRWRG